MEGEGRRRKKERKKEGKGREKFGKLGERRKTRLGRGGVVGAKTGKRRGGKWFPIPASTPLVR